MPIVASGRRVSVGWSKLCHSTSPPELRRTRFPLSRRTSTVVVLALMLAWLDQTVALGARFTTARLPSPENASAGEVGHSTGLSRLATHTGVSLGTLLNHTPKCHSFRASV
uniref:Uncharacterized protein n=1 Tax=Oryza brachyantha TaxID=4533 RepID=J3LXT0_ORYBR